VTLVGAVNATFYNATRAFVAVSMTKILMPQGHIDLPAPASPRTPTVVMTEQGS
jgi:hypothetical protein